MKQPTKPAMSQTKNEWAIAIVLMIITVIVGTALPSVRGRIVQSAWSVAREMLFILPAVLVLMGLFAVWVSKETVNKYLGRTSGVRGVLLALFFGALPTGPLYIAFPLAAGLAQKGARTSNIVIFLTAWACIKIPQELVEWQFLGARFMLARLTLTIFFACLIGFIVERALTIKAPKTSL
ncbi:MAG: permease [Patescibacteria group bacterium]